VCHCSLSGINLHPKCRPYDAAQVALGCDDIATTLDNWPRVTMHGLINQLSESQMMEALDTLNGDLDDHTSETGSSDWECASSDDGTSLGDDESSDAARSSSDDPSVPHAAAALGADTASWTHTEEDLRPSQPPSQRNETGSAPAQQSRDADATAADSSKPSGQGCIEPGVLALAVQGPMVACVDSMGNFLLRDFTAGVPGPELLRKCAVPKAAAAAGSAEGPAGGCDAASAADVAQQLLHLKFWQK
jgi:hypothetical protein